MAIGFPLPDNAYNVHDNIYRFIDRKESVDVLSFIMAGGRGTRLKILTKDTCKPMVGILGRYKVFDFVASNVTNTGIPVTLIASQFKSEHLDEYIGDGRIWGYDKLRRKLEILDPCKERKEIFEGTADSVRKSIDQIDRYDPKTVLVLGSDHIYAMNYREAIIQHGMTNADITIMTSTIPDNKVSDFGIVKIDKHMHIIDFAEKPTDKDLVKGFKLTPKMKKLLRIDDPNLNFLASMGNYIFSWDRLKRFLNFPGADFGKDIIPAMRENHGNLYACIFNGYWRDVGRVQDYFECNMEFTNGRSPIDFQKHRIWTRKSNLPFAQITTGSSIQNTILSPGDVIRSNNSIASCVLGQQVIIEENCRLDHCVFLGADDVGSYSYYTKRRRDTRVERGSSLNRVILDSNVWIGEGVDIGPHNGTPEERKQTLESIGLEPYNEHDGDMAKGDFYIEPDSGILIMGHKNSSGKLVLPDGLKC